MLNDVRSDDSLIEREPIRIPWLDGHMQPAILLAVALPADQT
jgi:hypothetical protein